MLSVRFKVFSRFMTRVIHGIFPSHWLEIVSTSSYWIPVYYILYFTYGEPILPLHHRKWFAIKMEVPFSTLKMYDSYCMMPIILWATNSGPLSFFEYPGESFRIIFSLTSEIILDYKKLHFFITVAHFELLLHRLNFLIFGPVMNNSVTRCLTRNGA